MYTRKAGTCLAQLCIGGNANRHKDLTETQRVPSLIPILRKALCALNKYEINREHLMSSVHPWNPPKGKFGVFPIRTEQRMLSWLRWLSSETEGPPQ